VEFVSEKEAKIIDESGLSLKQVTTNGGSSTALLIYFTLSFPFFFSYLFLQGPR
jgi:hypothetical protein